MYLYIHSFIQWTILGSKEEWSSVWGLCHRETWKKCYRDGHCHQGTQSVWRCTIKTRIHSLQLKCQDWNYIICHGNIVGGLRTLLFDEFLHVQPYLSITYSLYLWKGWMALFYPTPRIFQELQKDSGWSVQACVQGKSGSAARGQTGLPIASHSGRTLSAASQPLAGR